MQGEAAPYKPSTSKLARQLEQTKLLHTDLLGSEDAFHAKLHCSHWQAVGFVSEELHASPYACSPWPMLPRACQGLPQDP